MNLEFTLSVKSYHIPKENFHSCSKKMHLSEIQLNTRRQSNIFSEFSTPPSSNEITEPYICQKDYMILSCRASRPHCDPNKVVKMPRLVAGEKGVDILHGDVPNQKASKRHMLKISRSQLM